LGFTAEKRLTYDQGRALMTDAKRRTRDLVLMANITYSGDAGLDRCVACGMCYNCCPDKNIRIFNTGEVI